MVLKYCIKYSFNDKLWSDDLRLLNLSPLSTRCATKLPVMLVDWIFNMIWDFGE